MKIIHCADLHLDSKMRSNLDTDRAKKRRSELLNTFTQMIEYAKNNSVDAILISGDLFDTRSISATARNIVLSAIEGNQEISFFYLKGNHDSDNFLSEVNELPKNLYLFSDEWISYPDLGSGVVISGLEISSSNSHIAYSSLVLNSDNINIVMLHGQEAESSAKNKVEVINLRALRGKSIDYLALGHIHEYKFNTLDERGNYCYPGCLEGRGFDECGDHGFVLININVESKTLEYEFVPFAYRRLYTVDVDVTDLATSAEISDEISAKIQALGIDSSSLIKVILSGTLDVESEMDVDYLVSKLESQFFFAKIYNETKLKVDEADYRFMESLKGEFVRQVLGDDTISEDDKAMIIHYGISSLVGDIG